MQKISWESILIHFQHFCRQNFRILVKKRPILQNFGKLKKISEIRNKKRVGWARKTVFFIFVALLRLFFSCFSLLRFRKFSIFISKAFQDLESLVYLCRSRILFCKRLHKYMIHINLDMNKIYSDTSRQPTCNTL